MTRAQLIELVEGLRTKYERQCDVAVESGLSVTRVHIGVGEDHPMDGLTMCAEFYYLQLQKLKVRMEAHLSPSLPEESFDVNWIVALATAEGIKAQAHTNGAAG